MVTWCFRLTVAQSLGTSIPTRLEDDDDRARREQEREEAEKRERESRELADRERKKADRKSVV